jgi:microsomal epoxide hydrolase
MIPCRGPDQFPGITLNATDTERVKRLQEFHATGSGYSIEHQTRPSTIGFTVSSSPLALAAWIGEKLHEWTDKTPPMDVVLQWLTLYWLTQSFATSIYPYRWTKIDHPDVTKPPGEGARDLGKKLAGTYVDKPMG